MYRLLPQLAIFALIAWSNVANAQPPGRGGPPGFGGPGGSPIEMMSQMFDQADANRDGCLTKQELYLAMQTQRGSNQRGRGGPPPQNDGFGGPAGGEMNRQQPAGEHTGPPPRPGQVLPDFIIESLSLTDRQTRQLTALQDDVNKRLAGILTDEQEQQLQNPPPPRQGGHGAEDNERGRPQRPE
ncbi:EF-hand domain-containing protein [Novipirellula sp. SH528]|uniref:EF-hand domain-containing protein n=1 Tax=Novipirellula sp. SH528 TaxID=3454466 RepID=UPI003FA1222A